MDKPLAAAVRKPCCVCDAPGGKHCTKRRFLQLSSPTGRCDARIELARLPPSSQCANKAAAVGLWRRIELFQRRDLASKKGPRSFEDRTGERGEQCRDVCRTSRAASKVCAVRLHGRPRLPLRVTQRASVLLTRPGSRGGGLVSVAPARLVEAAAELPREGGRRESVGARVDLVDVDDDGPAACARRRGAALRVARRLGRVGSNGPETVPDLTSGRTDKVGDLETLQL
jgi:hypothetical protein